MGRRKKEPKSVHREKIATAASTLFMEKGIAATSMDDIAKAAGYSKATLYVYFENKEEIVGILVLNSMKKLYDYIASALTQQETTKERYDFICRGLIQYQEEFSDVSDGVYIGEYDVNFIYAKVEVTVQNGEITDIIILEHRHEHGKAAETVINEIVDEQRIDVDAVSGATNSSIVIKKAVENALKSGL